jgi:hypothetical protein
MSGQLIGLVAGLAAVPAIIFLVFYFAFGRRAVLASVVTTSLGTAGGAFLASAGSAMATSVNQNDALLQGAAIGFGGSAIVTLAVGLLLKLLHVRPTSDPR